MTNRKGNFNFFKKLLLVAACVALLCLFQNCRKNSSSFGINANFTNPFVQKPFSVSNVLNSNMVIQRDKPFVIWGSSHTGDTVKVKVSWNTSNFSVITDQSGDWKLSIPAAAANPSPQTISCTVHDTSSVSFNNILIGDVWICGGQSNMVRTLTILTNADTAINAANYPQIRASTIQDNSQLNPAYDLPVNAGWTVCTPATAANYRR